MTHATAIRTFGQRVAPTLLLVLIPAGLRLATAADAPPAPPLKPAELRDPFGETYRGYDPQFRFPATITEEERKLSSEPNFFTLNLVNESSRATALVEAGKAKEAEGRFNEAAEIYQKIIDEYPDTLYRVNEFGVFVPVVEYCQLRILGFPKADLDQYRTKHNSRARESFELARQRNSLEGLAQVRDRMLATSCGGPALKTLGYSALDRGHYLEALEYFEMVWDFSPELRAQDPDLSLSIALCRKMLGQGEKAGPGYGLIGHWKLDAGSGDKADDSSGCLNNGVIARVPHWDKGKEGGCLRFDWSNSVSVAASKLLNIGVGGSDFSVTFWLNWESGSYPNVLFAKRGRSADEMLSLEVNRRNQIHFAVATQSPQWERGATRGSVAVKDWTHVAMVKVGQNVKLFLNGRMDSIQELKAPVVKNLGGISFGQWFHGCLDEVRLYNRALLDREIAEFAGSVGSAALDATPASGEAPLPVEFSAGGAINPKSEYLWEFGDGAVASGPKARHIYGLGGDFTATLTVTDPAGPIAVGRRTVAVTWKPADRDLARRMGAVLEQARYENPPLLSQQGSAPNIGADDYAHLPPTADPLGLLPPVWQFRLPGSRQDIMAYSHPVVTANSVVYRHKNIVYCHSILNGELRWKNDLGGRVTWQNWGQSQFHQEDVLVQDGMVFSPLFKVGPTLAAFDEITGRLKWAYGPMTASTLDEANMRFESAPAGGPMTVYAGYIQDNIEGETHTDTEYGLMAFDSLTGRIKWRTKVCSLRPGQFSAGFATRRRNLIRSFSSPPLYHQGTVYYCSNAGATVAVDALSGRIKWLMRHPYHARIHDATARFGGGHHASYLDRPPSPMLWYGFRPLLVDDSLYVTPVNAPTLYCIQRRTGRVKWSIPKPNGNVAYFLGPNRSGELVLVTDGRSKYHRPDGNTSGPPLFLLDPESGRTLWTLPDLIMTNDHVVTSSRQGEGFALEQHYFTKGARPFLTADDHLIVPDFHHLGWPVFGYVNHLADVDLNARRLVSQRRYYTGEILGYIEGLIRDATPQLKQLEDIPHKDDRTREQIAFLKDVEKDTVPVNPTGPFFPFSRVTFERHGAPFELRISARTLEMVYDRERVRAAVAGKTDPAGLFARAELAMGDNQLQEAADLMIQCLGAISSEDLDFRATVNQLLFKLHKELARAGIRGGNREAERVNSIGMSRTVTTLADEVETLFAVSQAAERRGDFVNAGRQLQSIASIYGQYEYPVPEILTVDPTALSARLNAILDATRAHAANPLFGGPVARSIDRLATTFPVYNSAVSPLPKTLTLRAGELAAASLLRNQKTSPDFAGELDKLARAAIGGRTPDEQLVRLWEFPGTPTAQEVVTRLFAESDRQVQDASLPLDQQAGVRRRLWALADTARICSLQIPEAQRARVLAPPPEPPAPPLPRSLADRKQDMEEARGTAWLVLNRRGGLDIQPDLMFLGGRVKKKFDNKFLLYCLDAGAGTVVWKAQEKRGETWFDEIRLQGKGDEPGFFEAFVHGDLVIVHGMFDVLAFDLKDGRLRWRYEAPFAFEIRQAVKSGDLLVLAGQAETLALYIPTRDPRGEVAWQEKEEGDIYIPPYFAGDRLVSLRKSPSNLTVRYRSTGKLMGRLALPDLLMEDGHPILDNGPRELPVARDGNRLVVSDGWYYLMLDVERMTVLWKRLIDSNNPTRAPAMRLSMAGDFLAVVKEDYDAKVIYMLSSGTGEVRWHTDAKDPGSPQPLYSVVIRGDKLFGLRPHPGQAFYFTGIDARTGRNLFGMNEQKGYGGKPEAALLPALQGDSAVVLVKDRQDYEIKAFDLADGRLIHTLKTKATGDFGEHGRVSATAQGGRLMLLGKNELVVAGKK